MSQIPVFKKYWVMQFNHTSYLMKKISQVRERGPRDHAYMVPQFLLSFTGTRGLWTRVINEASN